MEAQFFCAIMCRARLTKINSVLRFDDKANWRSLRSTERLAPIRDFLFAPNDNVTVDERLIPFKGAHLWYTYMPSISTKYGLRACVAAAAQCMPKLYKMVTRLRTMHHRGNVIPNLSKQLPEIILYINESIKEEVVIIGHLVEPYFSRGK